MEDPESHDSRWIQSDNMEKNLIYSFPLTSVC